MPTGLTSPTHLFVITLVALVVLGPDKLPQALRQVGRTVGEVRRWSDAISGELRGALALDTDEDTPVLAPRSMSTPAPSHNGNGATAPLPPSPPPAAQADVDPSRHPALQQGGEWQ